jgi:DNA-binding CsgD family transcriptional regulator
VNPIRLLLVLLLWQVAVVAQPVHQFTNSPAASISNMEVLPDHGYTINTVCSDPSLPFAVNDSLRPHQAGSYWLAITIHNPFATAIPCNIKVHPNLYNTLYYFDANANSWVSGSTGLLATGKRRPDTDRMPCILRAHTNNKVYIHVQLAPAATNSRALRPTVTIEQAGIAGREEQLLWISWITSVIILFLFMLNNVYIWFSFKDKTVLYFFTAQLGGLIFITAYKQVFRILFPCPLFSMKLHQGEVDHYDLNSLLLHIGMLIIMYGLVQFGRSYFNTRQLFPGLDRLLRRTLACYLVLSGILSLINTQVFLEDYTWHADNIFTGVLFVVIIYISIAAYKQRLPAARPFLVANMLSLGFMLATSLFHLIMSLTHNGYADVKSMLPDLAIITQSIGFSAALVSRMRLLQQHLAAKETEARQLEFDLREMELRHQLISQQNETIGTEMQYQKSQNEQLQQQLEANQRELASISMYMAQKNELLAKLKTQIKDVKKQAPGSKQLNSIESMLQSNLQRDDEWTKFTLHFEQVHPNFFEELKAKHPNLTKNEMRLSAYFHMNLSTKEIASLLNIDPASVRRAKTRLYKKMGISGADKLTEAPDDPEL